MKKFATILLMVCFVLGLSAQTSNRRVVIDLILSKSRSSFHPVTYQNTKFNVLPNAAENRSLVRIAPIPKYCLPHGAIVCRLEEYVQLHSPFKLNIGVGGE